ncbi:MAG: Ku protein [Actinomycetota bacterium]|nr:Ku protein [Actinomycetota bacterium]
MHAIWKGTVSFGLVSIPVKLYSATEEKGVSFRQVHEADGGRIRYRRVCSVDGEEVAYSDIGKGFELPDGDVVVLSDADFEALPLPTRHTIEVLQFVPAEQIDGLYLAKGYYLSADGAGVKPYLLLRRALERSGRIALVKVALRNRESLAVLRPREDTLLVQTMLWPDEVRDARPFAPSEDVQLRDQEIAMAESYIETLSEDFDPSAYTDDYRTALEELVQAKAGGREVRAADSDAGAPSTVVDLMAALRASVEAARQSRSDSGASIDESAQAASPTKGGKRTAAKKTPAKTAAPAAARKTAAKTAVAKATAAKTPAAKSAATKSTATKAAAKKAPAKAASSPQQVASATKKATGKTAARKSA